jgi:hypothetical protein
VLAEELMVEVLAVSRMLDGALADIIVEGPSMIVLPLVGPPLVSPNS